jgi:hypothetical protein
MGGMSRPGPWPMCDRVIGPASLALSKMSPCKGPSRPVLCTQLGMRMNINELSNRLFSLLFPLSRCGDSSLLLSLRPPSPALPSSVQALRCAAVVVRSYQYRSLGSLQFIVVDPSWCKGSITCLQTAFLCGSAAASKHEVAGLRTPRAFSSCSLQYSAT